MMNESPPVIQGNQIDTQMPLHQLAQRRMDKGRDLKVIVTAEDSQTGVGKTTAAGFLALTWTKMFAGHDWHCEPDEPEQGMGTLHPGRYFKIIAKVGHEYNPGTVVLVDDAEELDARRSQQHLNVRFSQRWMLMRLKQAITIITLPSPSAIDSRLMELADVWVNVEIRGRAIVHDIGVNSYGSHNLMTEKKHKWEFPNVASHPELEKMRAMKERKMDEWDDLLPEDEQEEEVDPEEVERETLAETAQSMRNNGMTAPEIAANIPYGEGWVYKHTQSPEGGGVTADD